MKTFPAGLAAHAAGPVTTLARCWRIERRDGVVLGFTDHDRAIAFGSVTFGAADGVEAGGERTALGFRAGEAVLSGALAATGVTAGDIADGRYDGARVEVWLVNWAAPEERALTHVMQVEGIAEAGGAFGMTLKGRLSALAAVRGRLFQSGCDAELGDARCGVDGGDGAFHATGTVAGGDGRVRLLVEGLEAFAPGWFALGVLTWVDGPLAGLAAAVAGHEVAEGAVTLALRRPASRAIAPGTGFSVLAGCDKRFATCRAKFSNALNFRGFPHMPGNDFLTGRGGEPRDGGALF